MSKQIGNIEIKTSKAGILLKEKKEYDCHSRKGHRQLD